MFCPRCGREQVPSSSCRFCGYPFRWGVSAAKPPTVMRRYERQGFSRQFAGCLTTIVVAIVLFIGAVTFLERGEGFGTGAPGMAVQRGTPTRDAGSATSESSASPVADGAVVLEFSAEELSQLLAQHVDEVGPVSDPMVTIEEQSVQIHFRMFSVPATYRAQPVIRDGEIRFENAVIEAPLGFTLEAGRITTRLEAAVREQFAQSGMRPVAISAEPGVLRVMLEPSRG